MSWNALLKQLGHNYYTAFAMQAVCLIFIIIYIKNPIKPKSSKYLVIISVASIVQITITELGILLDPKRKANYYLDQQSMYMYLLIEITGCALYIRENIQSRQAKKLVLSSAIIFDMYIISFKLVHSSTLFVPSHIETLEGLLIIMYCLYYFYELFTMNPDKVLLNEPAFWAISGMLVLFSTITPLFLFFNYLRNNLRPLANSLYVINNISYILLFITFIIAITRNNAQVIKNV